MDKSVDNFPPGKLDAYPFGQSGNAVALAKQDGNDAPSFSPISPATASAGGAICLQPAISMFSQEISRKCPRAPVATAGAGSRAHDGAWTQVVYKQ